MLRVVCVMGGPESGYARGQKVWKFATPDWIEEHAKEIIQWKPGAPLDRTTGLSQCFVCGYFTSENGGACNVCTPFIEVGCGCIVKLSTQRQCSRCKCTMCHIHADYHNCKNNGGSL